MVKIVDTSPDALKAAFSGMMTGNIGATIAQTMVWVMILAAFAAVGYIIFMFITYKYKILIFKGYGDGKGGVGIGKPKFDLAKENKDGSMSFLFRRKWKQEEPFDSANVYPGNWVFVYEKDQSMIPGRVNVGEEENLLIEPVPYAVKKKIELELQQLELDFAKEDWWSANKIFVYMMIGAAIIIAFAGFVVWMSFEKADTIVPAMQGLAESMKNFNTIPGKG